MSERIILEPADGGGILDGKYTMDVTGTFRGNPCGIVRADGSDYRVVVERGSYECVPGDTVVVDVYRQDPSGAHFASFIRKKNESFLSRYLEEGATAKAVISARNKYDLAGAVSFPRIRRSPGGVDGVDVIISDCLFRRGDEIGIKVSEVRQGGLGRYTLKATPASDSYRKNPEDYFHVMKVSQDAIDPARIDKHVMESIECIPWKIFGAIFMLGSQDYMVTREMTSRIFDDDMRKSIKTYTNTLSIHGGNSHRLVVANNYKDLEKARDAIRRLGYAIDEVDCLNDF